MHTTACYEVNSGWLKRNDNLLTENIRNAYEPKDPKRAKTLWVSDIHLYNPRTLTPHTIRALLDVFAVPNLIDIDIAVIAGDLFDSAVSLASEYATEILLAANMILENCHAASTTLRILNGTKSHDREQSFIFDILNKARGSSAVDCVYVSDVCVEHFARIDMTMLYVPDEVDHDPEVVWSVVSGVLHAAGLDTVDFIAMHGMFDFQVPAGANIPAHNSERYLSILRRHCGVGHIHQYLPKGRIVPQGSLDRDRFGDEKTKGYVKAFSYFDDVSKDYHEFIINKEAMIYNTEDFSGLTLDDIKARWASRESYYKQKTSTGKIKFIIDNVPEIRSYISEIRTSIEATFESIVETNRIVNAAKRPETSNAIKIEPLTNNKFKRMILDRISDDVADMAFVEATLEKVING